MIQLTFNPYNLEAELELHEQSMIREIVKISDVNSDIYRGSKNFAEIVIDINDEPATIFVGFKDDYPGSLPLFFDLNNVFGRIPHKEKDGFICFSRSEAIVIDRRYPVSLLLNCLEKVIDLIAKGISGENHEDYQLEFEAYWRHIAKGRVYGAIDTNNHNVREINLWCETSESNFTIVASEKNIKGTKAIINTLFHIDIHQEEKYRCIYIPLKRDTSILPPANEEEWDYSVVKSIFTRDITKKHKKQFQKLVKRKDNSVQKRLEFIVFGLPLSNGNTALFAYAMSGTGFDYLHPLVQKPKKVKLIPLKIERWHPNYLLNRTGGNTEVSNKHVAIVGVGSVGSEIATRFAKSGIQHLTVIDNDILEMDNVYRHALGNDSVYARNEDNQLINVPKVLALEKEIKRKYPFIQVTSIPKSFADLWQDNSINWKDYDLLVVAIGSANQEMDINAKMHSMKQSPPTIYAWNEPLGVGGHSLITLNNEKKGCYQCLFKPMEGKTVHNRSSFTKPNQDFSKDLTGCGSIYVPYSFLDSEKTAMLVVENSLKLLTGKLQDNPLLSWKGDDSQLKREGFATSHRYSFGEQELINTQLLYKDQECPVCTMKG